MKSVLEYVRIVWGGGGDKFGRNDNCRGIQTNHENNNLEKTNRNLEATNEKMREELQRVQARLEYTEKSMTNRVWQVMKKVKNRVFKNRK